MLSGNARNKMLHGVVCDEAPGVGGGAGGGAGAGAGGAYNRETLNLRFGIHSPWFAEHE